MSHFHLQITHYINPHNINCDTKHKKIMAIFVSKSLPLGRYPAKIPKTFSTISHFDSESV